MDIILAVISLAASAIGILIGHKLTKKLTNQTEIYNYRTKSYADVASSYLLFIDSKGSRGEVVAAIEKALLLCSATIRPTLVLLESAVMDAAALDEKHLTKCRDIFSAFLEEAHTEVNAMWK